MDVNEIAPIRLLRQRLAGAPRKSVTEVVSWMGAMQAQDYEMVKWAIGIRLPESNEAEVEKAINAGEILRTHVLRPTWHLVSAGDISWMLDLTAPHIMGSMKGRHLAMGLSGAMLRKSNAILESALRDGDHLTRQEIVALLKKAGIPTNEYRSGHVLLWGELNKITCSGAAKDGNRTYAFFETRVSKTKSLMREEALAALAMRYFTSHSPATLQDFVWWSGLPVRDARHGLEMIKKNLSPEGVGSRTYWDAGRRHAAGTATVHLLPAYDEFIISYAERDASLPLAHQKRAVSSNGVFRPVILVNGMVAGVWRKSTVRDRVIVEATLFRKAAPALKARIEKESIRFGQFLNKTTELRFSQPQ